MFTESINGLSVVEFKPISPKRGWRSIFDSIRFKGRIREGKGEEKKVKK